MTKGDTRVGERGVVSKDFSVLGDETEGGDGLGKISGIKLDEDVELVFDSEG